MGGKAKTPKTPDYTALAKQQAADQQALIDKQTQANRATQTNPYGKLSWAQDANGNWTQNVQWDPTVKSNMDNLLSQYGSQIGSLGSNTYNPTESVQDFTPYQMTTGQYNPVSSWTGSGVTDSNGNTTGAFNADDYADAFTKSLLARVTPQQEVDRNSMEVKLRQQGLTPGTEAYDRAYKNLLTSQGDVNSQAALKGMLAASDNARQDYATQLSYDSAAAANNAQNQNTANSTQQQQYTQNLQNYLLPYQTATQVSNLISGAYQPTFAGYTPAGVGQAADIVGAAQQSYAQQMQNANSKNSSKSGTMSGIGGLAGGTIGAIYGGPAGATAGASIGSSAGSMFSDMRLKENIEPMSDSECYEAMLSLQPHKWKWIGADVNGTGVIAQQVASILPSMIEGSKNGMLHVDYAGLFAILHGAFRHLANQEKVDG